MSIDRRALVKRNNPVITSLEALSPLQVGNGRFAFGCDITGLQTLWERYRDACPVCTMAEWGWHNYPAGVSREDYPLTKYPVGDREVGYMMERADSAEAYRMLRINPHKFSLGRIRFMEGDAPLDFAAITRIHQELDMMSGILYSRFEYRGIPVAVETCCHPDCDCVAVRAKSRLFSDGVLSVAIDFPYASHKESGADFSHPDRHMTTLHGSEIRREMNDASYSVFVKTDAELKKTHRHTVHLLAHARTVQASFLFSQNRFTRVPDAEECFEKTKPAWDRFWSSGAAVELAHIADDRARELERRIVLSQYATAIQSTGMYPPAETGLTANSWYGKFHMEMYLWHSAHFYAWNRFYLAEAGLQYYRSVLPQARAAARAHGYIGARWPKMTDPSGQESPSPIGPMLIWQQPHPIYFAWQAYLAEPTEDTLDEYAPVVYETAEFMADYARVDAADGMYHLGTPMIPAQEIWPCETTRDPAFELTYWRFGLEKAAEWMEKMRRVVPAKWYEVLNNLAPAPMANGVYQAVESDGDTYVSGNRDHPSVLLALGLLPGNGIDPDAMVRTLSHVKDVWRWDETWGWDYPAAAMCACRLGLGGEAVNCLLMDTPKNTYLTGGQNYQRPGLASYLPGNGGLLLAVAMMCAGTVDHPAVCPGFPEGWDVHVEGMKPVL